jgi:hypothetical protein
VSSTNVCVCVATNARNGGVISPGSKRWRNDCADLRRLRAAIEEARKPAAERARELAMDPIAPHGKLARSIAAVDAQIAEARAALSVTEQQLKRHELAVARRTASAAVSGRQRS